MEVVVNPSPHVCPFLLGQLLVVRVRWFSLVIVFWIGRLLPPVSQHQRGNVPPDVGLVELPVEWKFENVTEASGIDRVLCASFCFQFFIAHLGKVFWLWNESAFI